MKNYRFSLTTNNNSALLTYIQFIKVIEKKFHIKVHFTGLPTSFKTITLLKSPHVNKRAKESFHLPTYKTTFSFKTKSALKASVVVKNLIINKPNTIRFKWEDLVHL
jgi:ribosomal protein S10